MTPKQAIAERDEARAEAFDRHNAMMEAMTRAERAEAALAWWIAHAGRTT